MFILIFTHLNKNDTQNAIDTVGKTLKAKCKSKSATRRQSCKKKVKKQKRKTDAILQKKGERQKRKTKAILQKQVKKQKRKTEASRPADQYWTRHPLQRPPNQGQPNLQKVDGGQDSGNIRIFCDDQMLGMVLGDTAKGGKLNICFHKLETPFLFGITFLNFAPLEVALCTLISINQHLVAPIALILFKGLRLTLVT